MSYKLSKYIHITKYNNKYLFFNLLSGALFSSDKEGFEKYNELNENFSSAEINTPKLFEILKNTRSIIQESVNEIDIIRMRWNKSVFLTKTLHLTINPTMDCNFKCWYCYEKSEPGFLSKKQQDNIIRYISNKIKNREIDGISLNWFGGEPLLYFDKIVYPMSKAIIKLCKENNIPYNNAITTNGYLINKEMIPKLNEILLIDYQITLDGNEDKHDETRILKNGKPTYKKIVENINLLCENINEIKVILRINYINNTLGDIRTIIDDFKKENRKKIEISFHRIWQTREKELTAKNTIKSELDYFGRKGFISNINKYFELYCGASCYANRFNQLAINYNGDIYKCTAREFNKNNRFGYLSDNATIVWDTNKLAKFLSKPTFDNKECLNCKFLPVCNGPCPQKYMENPNIDQICHMKKNYDISLNEFIISRYNNMKKKK